MTINSSFPISVQQGFFSLPVTATWFGVSSRTIKRWMEDGLPYYQAGLGRRILFKPSDVFHMAFEASSFQEKFLDRRPDLFFKVFHEGTLIISTEDSVLWNVEAGETEIVIEVDMPTS